MFFGDQDPVSGLALTSGSFADTWRGALNRCRLAKTSCCGSWSPLWTDSELESAEREMCPRFREGDAERSRVST